MRHRIGTFLAFVVALALMVFFLRNVELARVANAIASARRDLLVLTLLLVAVGYLIRAIRWRHLLAPLGQVGLGNALRATVIGFAVTSILPGRVGEVLRPYVLARREQLSASAVLATVVVERILDLVALLVLFGVSVVVFDPTFAVTDETLLGALRAGAWLVAAGAVVALAVACVAAGRPDRVGRFVGRLAVPLLQERVSTALAAKAQLFATGLSVMRQPAPLALAMGWSVVLWVTMAAGLWLVSVSFGIQMPPAGANVLLVLVVLGVLVPTPGGIGGYHAAYQVGAIGLYAATDEAAVGAGLLSHALSFFPVVIVGIVLMAQEGLRLSGISDVVGSGRTDGATSEAAAGAVLTASVGEEGRVG